ncbi:signal peptidase I [Roseibacterium beibuensis]|uniref:signal peptidase I n=1 Tax=[Roseibacterium] beibuensis TaxID=1193142 RepID=UPI00217D1627|nr:signal peptidase I [Roseibacterium beibuensis]MCS6625309.1 signal peptidase I [Roseibacterium beibuensis]
MSDENKPHDDHGHDAGHGRDDHAPAHDETAAHSVETPGHEEAAPDAHPVVDAHAADHAGHGHEAHVEAAHGDHAEATAAASSKQPVWSDSGDAPFEDVEATPVYARGGKKGRKKGKSGGNEMFEIVKTIVFALLIAFVLRVLLFQPFTIPSASMEPNLYEGDYIVVSKWSYGYSKHAIPLSPPLFEGRIFAQEPERGDIVVFKLPRDNKTDYIKRLIGLPGDRVQMINNVLHINGEPVRDVVISEADATNMYGMPVIKARETLPGGRTFTIQDYGPGNQADDTPVFEVPEGHYFMMGDNRDNSVDSRYGVTENGVGLVPAENLIGKAEIILFSWKPGASLWNPISWFSKVQPSRFFTDLD